MFKKKSSQTVDNITTTLATNILTAIQSIQNNTDILQQISGKCTTETIQELSKSYTDCLLNYTDTFNDDDLLHVCSVFPSLCQMNNINLSASLNVDNISMATDEITQSIQTAITNSLSQFGGNKTNQYIKNITNVSNTIATNIIDKITTSSGMVQTINLNNVSANNISIKSALDIVRNVLQNNTVYQSNINSIINIITQVNVNQNSIYTSLLIFSIVLAISGVMISIIMTLKRSKDINDFFNRIFPVIMWVIVCLVTIVLHIVLKPDYVCYYDVNGNKYINKQIFFFVMLGYCICVGILIKGYLLLKQKL